MEQFDIIDWLITNKEWLFSGAGIYIISSIMSLLAIFFSIFLFRRKTKFSQNANSKDNSLIIQGGRDISVGDINKDKL